MKSRKVFAILLLPMIILIGCTTKPSIRPTRVLPAKYKLVPPKLEKTTDKRYEAVVKIRNVKKFGIVRRNYVSLQNWAKSCK